MFRYAILSASFVAAFGLAVLWEATPAHACKQQHCFTYEQWARPGFDPKKERPLGGPGKYNRQKDLKAAHDRAMGCNFAFSRPC